MVYGPQELDYSDIEDLVLIRSDGHPLYNLSVVVDDIEMGITHVIRGQDHLTNTHKQVLIYNALGTRVPRFGHLPLINAPGKEKLSKRKHGEIVSVTTYRDRGFLPDAFVNFLALLGWSPGGDQEIMSRQELIEQFSLDGVNKAAAIFNFKENDPPRLDRPEGAVDERRIPAPHAARRAAAAGRRAVEEARHLARRVWDR